MEYEVNMKIKTIQFLENYCLKVVLLKSLGLLIMN